MAPKVRIPPINTIVNTLRSWPVIVSATTQGRTSPAASRSMQKICRSTFSSVQKEPKVIQRTEDARNTRGSAASKAPMPAGTCQQLQDTVQSNLLSPSFLSIRLSRERPCRGHKVPSPVVRNGLRGASAIKSRCCTWGRASIYC